MVGLMVGKPMTIEGREQGRRVLLAVQHILQQPVDLRLSLTALVRYCADELDVPAQFPLALLAEVELPGTEAWLMDERLEAALQEEPPEPAERSGVFRRTEHGIVRVAL